MKLDIRFISVVTSVLALPISAMAAETIKEGARDTWDATKSAAVRTGETVEHGAEKVGRAMEHGAAKTEHFFTGETRGLGTPHVFINEERVKTPGIIPAGSDLVVRNTGDTSQRFSVRGRGVRESTFLKPGQSKRLDLDLPPGNYSLSSSEGIGTVLRVR